MPAFLYVVYKLTFPNGKIYIGKDIGGSGHSLRYFGSWNNAAVEADFSKSALINFFHFEKKFYSKAQTKLKCRGWNPNGFDDLSRMTLRLVTTGLIGRGGSKLRRTRVRKSNDASLFAP